MAALVLLVVALAVGPVAPTPTQAALPTPTLGESQEITYPANGRPQMEEFRTSGKVTLTVPKDPVVSPTGTLTVDAEEQRIYATRDISIYRDGAWQVVGQMESINVLGAVQGHPLSQVNLLLDPHGIYGMVEIPMGSDTAEFKFHPYADDPADNETFMQHVWLKRNDPASEALDEAQQSLAAETHSANADADGAASDLANATEPDAQAQESSGAKAKTSANCSNTTKRICEAKAKCDQSSGTTFSVIWMIATSGSTGFAAKHKDWQARITSAFTDFKPLLLEKGLCIDAYVKLSKTDDINSGGPTVLSSASCSASYDVVEQFQDWLHTNSAAFTSAPSASETDSYQLWTAKDLTWSGNGYSCYGLSDPDEVARSIQDVSIRKWEALDAASVVEGHEIISGNGYNANDQKHRAIVLGHELSHAYGQENHPNHRCGGNNPQYNIMKNDVSKDQVDLCYTSATASEIKFRYFQGREP